MYTNTTVSYPSYNLTLQLDIYLLLHLSYNFLFCWLLSGRMRMVVTSSILQSRLFLIFSILQAMVTSLKLGIIIYHLISKQKEIFMKFSLFDNIYIHWNVHIRRLIPDSIDHHLLMIYITLNFCYMLYNVIGALFYLPYVTFY